MFPRIDPVGGLAMSLRPNHCCALEPVANGTARERSRDRERQRGRLATAPEGPLTSMRALARVSRSKSLISHGSETSARGAILLRATEIEQIP
jgi:hypothetical protein